MSDGERRLTFHILDVRDDATALDYRARVARTAATGMEIVTQRA